MFDRIKKSVNENLIPILKNKKLQLALTIICLLAILYFAVSARTGNINYLKDQTSGKWIPMDLDSYYFLRIAETMESNGGTLPPIDNMRYYTMHLGWSSEYLPKLVYNLHTLFKAFDSNSTIAYADIWYPIISFVASLLLFFILTYLLTKSKALSLLGVLLFAFIPTYLYPTTLGATDHDSLGITAFLLMLTSFAAAIILLEKKDEEIPWWKFIVSLIWFAFTASFVIACWNGIAIYMFMIIPMAYLFIWIIKSQDINRKNLKLALFYLIGFPLIFLLVPLWGDFSILTEFARYSFQPQGLLGPFTYGFILVDLLLIWFFSKNKDKEKISSKTKFRVLFTLGIIILFMIIILQLGLLHKNTFEMIASIAERMLNPFGRTRIGLTVSENQQPFFSTWITSFGKLSFWIAFLGMIFIGIRMARGLSREEYKKSKQTEDRITFVICWGILVGAILFTRYSPTGIFNGDSLVSIGTFFFGFLLFIGSSIGFYLSTKVNIKNEIVLIACWIVIMLISGRGAARLFIIISPLFVIVSVLLLKGLFDYAKIAKEELLEIITWITIILFVGAILFTSLGYYNGAKAQTAMMGPAANYQWQNAMNWVRSSTPIESHFVHWWDYGYWVQYFGERATLTDGGHGAGYYDWLTGRYMLTGTRPDLALSFMKTNEVNYLLIDPTDIGKYTAFSSIGSDSTGADRTSWIPIMVQNTQWSQEYRNETTLILQGGGMMDEDINYEENGSRYSFPAGIAGIGGVKITVSLNNSSILQPKGIFVYNNKQIELPIRYMYVAGKLYDFNIGIPSIIRIVSSATQNAQGGLQIDKFGAAIYISPRVAKTLFANIYLMNDPNNLYPTIKIAHTEEDYAVNSLKNQGAITDSFFYYQGLRAPLQIYKINYPDNILSKPEYFIPHPGLNEEIVLANKTLLKEIDNLVVTK